MDRNKRIMFLSFGTGGLFVLIGMVVSGTTNLVGLGNSLILAGVIVAFLPYNIYSYFIQVKVQKMERVFPTFLRDISESHKSGLSLPKAFKEASSRDYHAWNEEIKKISAQLSWGVPFPEVIKKTIDRLGSSKIIARSMNILLQSYSSGGDISKTLDTLSRDTMNIRESEEKRNAALKQHLLTIYIIFFLFVFIIISLYNLGIVPLLGTDVENEFFGRNVNFCQVDGAKFLCSMCPAFGFGSPNENFCYYKIIFMFMVIVQGIFNGLVAGQVGEGKAILGLKHSLIMAVFGFLAYIIFI